MFEFKGAFASDPALRRLGGIAIGLGLSGLTGMFIITRKRISKYVSYIIAHIS